MTGNLINKNKYCLLYFVTISLLGSSLSLNRVEAANTFFSPDSCVALDSTDITVHLSNQIDDRIDGVTASNSTKSLWDTRGNSSGGWDWNEDVWTDNGDSVIDWTGMSPYNTTGGYTRAGTLITPRHIVFANHYQISNGATVTFVGSDNSVVNRTLSSKQSISGTDMTIGLLSSDVPTSTITHYPIFDYDDFSDKIDISVDIPMITFDQQDHAIIKEVNESSKTWGSSLSHKTPSSSDRANFNETLIGGDSGNTGFLIVDGKPVLVLSHYSAGGGPNYTYYKTEINNILSNLGGGYEISEYDLDCFEVPPNGGPVIGNTSVSIQEGSSAGTVVKYYTNLDLEDDDYTIEITSGNTNDAFYVEGKTVRVNSPFAIDYETNPTFVIGILATDDGSPVATSTGTLTINLNDVEDYFNIDDQSMSIDENSSDGSVVGTLTYANSDESSVGSSTISFSFSGGPGVDYFNVNSSTGQITVEDEDFLDYETNTSTTITIRGTERDSETNDILAEKLVTLTVNINDIENESAPTVSVDNSSFSLNEDYTSTTTILATVTGSDDDGDALFYTIESGNDDDVFSIDISSGEITAFQPENLDYETNSSYELVVKVAEFETSEGSSVTTTIDITINDIDENTYHTVTFLSGSNGSLTGSTTQVILEGEDTSAVTAAANSSYDFSNWTGDVATSSNPLTLTNITEDIEVTANFIAEEVEVPTSSGSSGGGGGGGGSSSNLSVSCEISTYKIAPGSTILIKASAEDGEDPYHYEWSGDISGLDMDENDNQQYVTFNEEGNYDITVEVEDEDEDDDSDDCKTVSVSDRYDLVDKGSVINTEAEIDSVSAPESPSLSSLSVSDQKELKNLITVLSILNIIDSNQVNLIMALLGSEPVPVSGDSCPIINSTYKFTRSLDIGSIGNDVLELQKILNSNGYVISSTGPGSPGNESTYFGQLTQKALIRLQNDCYNQILKPVGLVSGTGYFGQATIDYLN